MASETEDKRWSLVDEISKLFKASLDRCFPELEEEAEVSRSTRKEHGDYVWDNVLTIWPKLRNNDELRDDHPRIKRPRDVGKAIKKNLPDSAIDMIEGRPSVFDVGFVTFSLSPKWMAESIHRMLKNGIHTWAPKLPVERVLVKYPSLDEEIHTGLFRRSLIAETLVHILSYSKVDVTMTPTTEKDMLDSPIDILKKWFSIEKRSGGEVVISVEDKPPFILAKKDLNHLSNDLEALRYGFEKENADWMVYVTPVRQQEYIEMCFTAAKLEKWTPTDRKWQWVPDGTSYVGYRSCNIEPKELASLLDEVEACCNVVAQGEDAKLLGYNAKSVSDCVLWYTLLKDPRLANCTFTSDEMVGEEGNTFLYLLQTRAKIRRITDDYRKDIYELTKASEVIVEINEQSEHALELHLLGFTEALKRSCSFISPHILCDYLYELSKQFNNCYPSVCGVGCVVERSTLLLCEATAVVLEKCFLLLGILRGSKRMTHQRQIVVHCAGLKKVHFLDFFGDMEKLSIPGESANSVLSKLQSSLNRSNDVNSNIILEKEYVERCVTPCFVSAARVVCIIPDGGSHIFEPDFAYVPLFDHEWFDPIEMNNREFICLGNPSFPNSVPFSSSVEINMEIYVINEEKTACYEVCRTKVELDLLDIWSRNLGSKCGLVKFKGEDGYTEMYYMLIKDAVDAAVEVRYKSDRGPGKVRAQIYAYYGSDILDVCIDTMRPCYWALLFRSDVGIALEELGEKIPLRKAVMAVPKGAPLKIFATLYDIESEEWILDGTCELSSLTEGSSKGRLEGTECSLSLKVDWTYQAQ